MLYKDNWVHKSLSYVNNSMGNENYIYMKILSMVNGALTHCSLVTPYGDIDLGKHWLRW